MSLTKQELRAKIWSLFERKKLLSFPMSCYGRIPNFINSTKVCELLLQLEEFKKARCIFCAPDAVLRRARELVLENGKVLAVATPHMRKFLELTNVPKDKIKLASTIRGFELFGRQLKTKVELFVQGAVAVDLKGNRLGKGAGYGDKEYWYLKAKGLLAEKAPVVAIVHELQIQEDFSELMTENDVKLQYIITSKRVLHCQN
jgi:5-formyltetrahydrofolate cyclo-ligase